jgi:ribonuclease HI
MPFQMLGIVFATEGKKAVSWDTKIETLGVVLDLAPASEPGTDQRFVRIGHTESRIQELRTLIETILDRGAMSCKDAERLRGRLQWFETFAHGRIAQQSLKVISSLASVGRKRETLGAKEIGALQFLKDRVLTASPTKVMSANLQTWYVFSDGACEGETEKIGSVGAVLINSDGQAISFFSEKVPDVWMSQFMQESKHPVFELELLPIVVALCVWEKTLKHCQSVFYLDNEAARGALISGSTQSVSGSWLVRTFTVHEMHGQLKVWFARVPTSSNIADKPSRLDVTELVAEGINRVDIKWTDLLEQCQKYKSDKWGDG